MGLQSHKFRILLDHLTGKITEKAVVQKLDVLPKTVRQLMTVWGPLLPRMVPVIDNLLQPTHTKAEQASIKRRLAAVIGTTERQVNRLLIQSNITLPDPVSVKKSHRKA